jgi:hypothetical protein
VESPAPVSAQVMKADDCRGSDTAEPPGGGR